MPPPTRLLRSLRLPKPIQSSRSYHSYDHAPPPGPFNAVETSILSASLPHIPAHGFTQTTLALGAKDAGYIDASVNLFQRGAFSVVHYHLVRQREALKGRKEVLEQEGWGEREGGKKLGVGGWVKELAWERLMGNREVVHMWQEALALVALPSNIPISVKELAALSDEIWFLAGDTSVDSSWYTKRASLSAIYAATELFMTTDKSPDYVDTKEFMDRRFKDLQTVGGAVGSVGQWVGFTAHAGLNVLRSKGVRL